MVTETGSTNADLLAAAGNGAPEGVVLVTDHQTAGRGRQRRHWHDDPGNALLVSILLRPTRSRAPLLPLMTGVAAVGAVASLLEPGRAGAGLKWPNDVLVPSLDERKLAGILAESTTATGTGHDPDPDELVVVVGMGLNLRWGRPPPAEIRERAATLTELAGRPIDRDEILDRYLRSMELWLRRLEADGEPALLDRYRRCCLTIGRTVRFATGEAEHVGTATDITARGTLLLDTGAQRPVELHAGDAHHLPA